MQLREKYGMGWARGIVIPEEYSKEPIRPKLNARHRAELQVTQIETTARLLAAKVGDAFEERKAAEDGDWDGVVTVAELQARPGLDTNKDGEVTEEEAKFFLGDKDSFDLDSFKDGAYALIKPYLDLEKVTAEPEDPVAIEDEGMAPPAEDYHPPDHPMMKDTKEAAYDPEKPDYPMNTPPPPTDIDGVGDGDYDEQEEDEDYDITDHEDEEDHKAEEQDDAAAKPESKYDERTQALIAAAEAARAEYNSADRQLRDLEREITRLSEGLGKEYGPDSVFAVLQVTNQKPVFLVL